MSLWTELKRRNVLRVVAAYVVVGWLVLQVADIVFGFTGVPDWVGKLLITLIVLGFPPVLAIAWIFELTPDGVRRESELPPDHENQVAARRLDYVTISAVVALAGITFFQLFKPTPDRPAALASPPAAAQVATAPAPAQTRAIPSLPAPPNSLAVLPFANMSASEENEYFADGLTEELLNLLAQIPSLQVAGRTSSFYFKDRTENLMSIGEQLNVAHVLEGSVRRAGDRLRITAQLVKVEDGFHVWSQTYDRVFDDVFAIQEEIAAAIGAALEVEFNLVDAAGSGQTDDIDAYSLYLKGRQLWNTRSLDNLQQAVTLFREAIVIDPDYALAWSGLADAIDALVWRVPAQQAELLEEGVAAARRAIELAPAQAAGYASLGVLQSEFLWKFDAAAANLRRSIELNPAYVPALHWYADTLRALGRLDAALRTCDRALAIDPLAPVVHSTCGSIAFDFGLQDRGVDTLLQAIELSPDILNVNFSLPLLAQIANRMTAQSGAPYLIRWAQIRQIEDPERITVVLRAWEDSFYASEALALLQSLESHAQISAMERVALYAHIDAFEPAIDALEAAFEAREGQILYAATWARLPEALRDDPRFEAVLRKAGLPTRREIANQ